MAALHVPINFSFIYQMSILHVIRIPLNTKVHNGPSIAKVEHRKKVAESMKVFSLLYRNSQCI